MAPWLPSLRSHVIASDSDGEKARDKAAIIFRKLIDVAMSDPSLSITLEQSIWPEIFRDEIHAEIILEELIKTALAFGADDDRVDVLGSEGT
jgi:neurofibromin 1